MGAGLGLLVSPVGQAGGGDGAVADYPMSLDPLGASVLWSVPGWYSHGSRTQGMVINVYYFVPIFVTETKTYDRIALEVTTAIASNLARLGIYEWANGLPGDLLLDAGTVDCSAIGIKTIVINQALTRGYYFLAMVHGGGAGGCTFRTLQRADAVSPPVGGLHLTTVPPSAVILTTDALYAVDVGGGLRTPAPVVTVILEAGYAGIYMREV